MGGGGGEITDIRCVCVGGGGGGETDIRCVWGGGEGDDRYQDVCVLRGGLAVRSPRGVEAGPHIHTHLLGQPHPQ